MIELVIGKHDYMANMVNSAFNIDVLYFPTTGHITDMRVPRRACSGVYITNNSREPGGQHSITLNYLADAGELTKPIIIFDSIHIIRELTSAEKISMQAIGNFINTEIDETEVRIGDTFKQIEMFKSALNILRDKNVVNKLLPVPVECIAFIEMCNTEGDFILSREAKLIDTWETNNNRFNIYKLW